MLLSPMILVLYIIILCAYKRQFRNSFGAVVRTVAEHNYSFRRIHLLTYHHYYCHLMLLARTWSYFIIILRYRVFICFSRLVIILPTSPLTLLPPFLSVNVKQVTFCFNTPIIYLKHIVCIYIYMRMMSF